MRATIIAGVVGILCTSGSAIGAEPLIPPSQWTSVQPVAALSIHRLVEAVPSAQFKGGDGFYVIEGRIVDAVTGATLMQPRLITRRGEQATIEGGRTDGIMVKIIVLVDAAGDRASSSTEVRDGDAIVSTSTTHFVLART